MNNKPGLKYAKTVSIINLVISIFICALGIGASIFGYIFIKNLNGAGNEAGDAGAALGMALGAIVMAALGIIMIAFGIIATVLGAISMISSITLLVNASKSLEAFYEKKKTVIFSAVLLWIFAIVLFIIGAGLLIGSGFNGGALLIILLGVAEIILASFLTKSLRKIKKYIDQENSASDAVVDLNL